MPHHDTAAARTDVPAVTYDDFLALVDLESRGDPEAPTSSWVGRSQAYPDDRVFGGLLLAQAVASAGRTVRAEHRPTSLQAAFIGGVPTDRPIRWAVTRVQDAGSMSTRRSSVVDDDGRELFTAVTRWAGVREDLPSHRPAHRASVPRPEALPSLVERFGDDPRIPPWWRMERPVEFRHTAPPPYVAREDAGDRQTTWVKATRPVVDDPVIRAALVAYVTDMSILEAAFRAVGSARHAPGSRILSLDHSLVFHRVPDLSDWHQFDTRIEAMTFGRALGQGEFFTREGEHVASATQFGLIKAPSVD